MRTWRRSSAEGARSDQFLRHQPINQPNRAVVAELQSFRQLAHGDFVARGKALDGQQGLILLRRDAGGLARLPR